MDFDLLVIEGTATPAEARVQDALAAAGVFRCRALGWERVTPDVLARKGPTGIVAVAVPSTPRVTEIFRWLRDNPIPTPTVAILAADAQEPLLRLASDATDDFLISPIRGGELRQRLERLLGRPGHDLESVQRRLVEEFGLAQLVGNHPRFAEVVDSLPRLARSELPVLITGETGTGKELCARALHCLGRRAAFPFIAVDCAAIPEHLFENEMFGHVRGAFTDAHRDQAGLAAMAEGGTLFLDEIDALSLSTQAKLLRLVQERTYRPLGSNCFKEADVNVIAATNRNLEARVREKRFRADLFFRLNVLHIHIPALRDRRSDIAPLALHFLKEMGRRGEPLRKAFSPAALRKLSHHDWPGNVRELANVVQRAAVLSEGAYILPHSIPLADPTATDSARSFREARAAALAAFERQYVEELLQRHDGNVTHAAREAAKERRAFGRLVKKYHIDRKPRGD